MPKPSHFRTFAAFALMAAGLFAFHAWYESQNEHAVSANVLIALDRADHAYAGIAFLPVMEAALKHAQDKGQLTGLRADAFAAALAPLHDEKQHPWVWAMVNKCDPGSREQVIPPDPTVIACTGAIDEARIKLNRDLGRSLSDAVLGAAYLKDERAAMYDRKKAPLCRRIFSYARENAAEDYFEPGVLLFYFSSCDEAHSRILFSKELDGAFKSCAAMPTHAKARQGCIDRTLASADFGKTRIMD